MWMVCTAVFLHSKSSLFILAACVKLRFLFNLFGKLINTLYLHQNGFMKNILIIGGSSGIGHQLVQDFLRDGNTVYASWNTHSIEQFHPNLTTFQLDVRHDEWVLEDIEELDALVYCPGTIHLKPFHRFSEEDLIEDLKINVLGAQKVIKAVLSRLKKSSNPSITLFSSVAVSLGFPFHTQVGISKGALEGFTKSLAAELSPTIRVNAVAPSITTTPLAGKLLSSEEKIKANGDRHPLRRVGEPADIASMVSFLVSDKATWITGQIMNVDGGMSALKT